MVQTTVNNLIINKMTKAQYTDPSFSPNSNELYFITDDTGVTTGDLLGDVAIGSSAQPIYWDGDSFEPITSYSGNAATATKATGANLSTTQNAIAKYSNTTGTFANSGVIIDGSNNISTAGHTTTKHLYIFGTVTDNKTNRYITSNSSDNILFYVNGTNSLVVGSTAIRRGSSTSANLGTSDYPWNNIYGVNLYGDGSNITLNTANKFVMTDTNNKLITTDLYWANQNVQTSTSFNTTPEVATIKLNGNTSAVAASTKNVVLQYNATSEVLNFNFT